VFLVLRSAIVFSFSVRNANTAQIEWLDSHRIVSRSLLISWSLFVSEGSGSHLNLFNSRQQAKKKRKSRTAFTNHQIFELEKRFLYQKYLSPADRDEIAANLGLSNAQVITWFQVDISFLKNTALPKISPRKTRTGICNIHQAPNQKPAQEIQFEVL